MRKERETRSGSPQVSTTRAKRANISAQVVAAILERSSPLRRLTHDTGLPKERLTIIAGVFEGTHLITGSAGGTVHLWDIASGECVRVFPCGSFIFSWTLTTPRSNRMITAGRFGNKKVWDLETGDCIAVLRDHPGTPSCCNDTHFFCRQDWDVTPLFDKSRPPSKRSEVLVYEVDTGKRFRSFEIEGSHIDSLAVSPDGKKAAAATDDHFLSIWDLETGDRTHRFSPGRYFRKILGITPDSRLIVLRSGLSVDVRDMAAPASSIFTIGASRSNMCILRGFHLLEQQKELTPQGFLSAVRITDIRTGKTVFTDTFTGDIALGSVTEEWDFCLGSHRGRIDVWDMKNHRVTASETLDPYNIGWIADSNTALFGKSQIVISREESVVRLVDPPSGQFTTFPAREPVRDALVTPDGKGLLTMGPSAVKHWDLTAGRCLSEFTIPKMGFPDGLPAGSPLMAVTPDGSQIVLPRKDGIVLWDLSTGRKTREFQLDMRTGATGTSGTGPFALHVTPDGKRLAAVSGPGGFLGLYDITTGAPVAGFPLDITGRFHAFCMGPDLFATSEGTVLSLWDGETGRLLRRHDQGDAIEGIAFLPSKAQVVTTSLFRLRFWDLASGEMIQEADINTGLGHNRFGKWISTVPGERQLLVHNDHRVGLWDMAAHRFRWRDLSSTKNRVKKAVPFPDGKRFVAVDTTGMVEVRGIEKGEVLAALHTLPDGFVWETPPDTHAPSGWLWTDREDLVSVIARSRQGRNTKVFRKGDDEHTFYLKIYNNRGMVTARIEGEGAYRRQVGLYACAMDEALAGSDSGRSPAALPAGGKGDRK